jgi:acetyl-CoA acyltransferase 1
VNRQCSSGLQAVASIAGAIKAGYIDVGIGAGVESMTHYYGPQAIPTNLSKGVMQESAAARKCLLPMGMTSENVAKRFGISRADQDTFAVESHKKAAKAQAKGDFEKEIVVTCGVSRDDGIRGDSSMEQLSQLKASFSQDGSTTAGNASQVSDGAAAVLLMRRSKARELGVAIMARFLGFAAVGCAPEIMGVGPVYAIPAVLKQTGLRMEDVGVFELNEAFASQALYCIRTLGLPMDKVNPSGGAIALGHPLGATGARQIATMLGELSRRNARYGVVSMCIGTGMGAAAVIENEQK